MAATGGQDAQSIDGIRSNAPQTVLTLGRAVSITDYQNFAAPCRHRKGLRHLDSQWNKSRGFSHRRWRRRSGPSPGNLTLANLVSALQEYGNPNVTINAQSFYETLFSLCADIAYDPPTTQMPSRPR